MKWRLEMELNGNIKLAIERNQELYWQLNGNWLDLRAITYTFEKGTFRTKRIMMYYLKDQLNEIVETQKVLGKYAPINFWKELEPAYWNKVIDIHPRNLIAKEK